MRKLLSVLSILGLFCLAFNTEALIYKSVLAHPENFDNRPDNLSPSVIHIMDTGQTLDEALNTFKEPKEGGFSVHYLIPEDGKIVYRLVPEEKNALHTRNGIWQNIYSLNSHSIGVALVTSSLPPDERPTQWSHKFPEYSEAQIQALIQLCKELITKWDIKPWNVVGNSDIAPGRFFDPGLSFPWEKLAEEGIGIWPKTAEPVSVSQVNMSEINNKDFILKLSQYGYAVPEYEPNIDWNAFSQSESVKKVIAAFQAHFRPSKVDGVIDLETKERLEGLLQIKASAMH